MQMIGLRVLVKPVEKTKSEVEMFEATERQDVEAEVVLSGIPLLSPGTIVIFNKYAGHEVELEGIKHKILFVDEGIDGEVLMIKKGVNNG